MSRSFYKLLRKFPPTQTALRSLQHVQLQNMLNDLSLLNPAWNLR